MERLRELTWFRLLLAVPPDIVFPRAEDLATNGEAIEAVPASWLVGGVPVAGRLIGPNSEPAVALVTRRPRPALLDDSKGPKIWDGTTVPSELDLKSPFAVTACPGPSTASS